MNNPVVYTVLLFCGLIFISNKSYSQDQSSEMNPESRSHIGIAIGAINYGGFMDRQYNNSGGYSTSSRFTSSQASLTGELMYRYDFSDQFHVRASGMLGLLQHSNAQPPDNLAYEADNISYGSFKAGIAEVDIMPEFDIINMSTNKWHYRYKWSPYIFGGPGFYKLLHYSAKNYAPGDNNYSVQLFSFNFRWGLGVKYAVTPGIQLFLEGSWRQFSKQIDFFNNGVTSRYYSVTIGGMFSLQKRHFVNYW